MVVTTQPASAQLRVPKSEGVWCLRGDHGSLSRFQLAGARRKLGKLELVSVVDLPGYDSALRLTTTSDPGSEWGLQVQAGIEMPVEKGDVLLAGFWMRCVESMTGEGFTGLVVEEQREPAIKAAELRVGASADWVQCFLPFRAPIDFSGGQARVVFRGGYDRQVIEIGGIEVVNYGKAVEIEQLPRTHVTYAGRSQDAPWREAARERIDRIRKADLRVDVVDGSGRPVPDAQVHFQLRKHAFGFGSCVTADQITGDSPDDLRARQVIQSLFNRVVFENDMKWPAMWNGPTRQLDQAVAWLLDRGIEVRGHNLHWPSWQWSPAQLRAYESDPVELRRHCEARVTETVCHFRGKLAAWDVVNEPYNNVDLLNLLGRDVMVHWFKLARAADPSVPLYINDFGIFDGGKASEHRRHYYETIRYLLDAGAPVDGVGIQSHFGAVMPSPTQLLDVLDQFAGLGLPIESTEFSLNTEDRQLQADFMRDYMTAVFSHAAVRSIVLWGFWEGRHWRPNAALWTRDWTLRPHGQVWLDLLTREWNTDEKLQTAGDGSATVRGFLGDYQIVVTKGRASITTTLRLETDGFHISVVLK